MEPTHLKELIELEDGYWWHVAKRQLVTELLTTYFAPPGKLVEGGVGSARNLVEFQRLGYEVHGFDIMQAAVDHAHRRGLANVSEHNLSLPWPLPDGSVRVAVLLDVLEHLEDPVQVLRHVHKVLESGGGMVVTVPAYPWLFSDWDQSLGHYRRYTARTLRRHAEDAGFRLEWVSHWNSFTLPAAIAVRGYERLRPADRKPEFPRVTPFVNRLLHGMAKCERNWLRKRKSPFGLSIVGVLRK